MCDENTFAAAYRSDLRDEIVETLKDYADGLRQPSNGAGIGMTTLSFSYRQR